MAIERIEQRRGGWAKVDSVQPGTSERISPRGFWPTLLSALRQDFVKQQITGVDVKSSDEIHKIIIEEGVLRWPKVESAVPLKKEAINDEKLTTGEFGLFQRRIITYRWKRSEEQNEPQNHLSEKKV